MTAPNEVHARRFAPARLVALACAALGAALSVYLTIEHYSGSNTLACPESATVNCQKVTESRFAEIVGVPVAVLGLVFFVTASAVLLVPGRSRAWATVRLVGAGAGVLFVFWLVYVELFEVEAICLWCTGVHVLTLVLFVATLWEFLTHDTDDTDASERET